MRENDSFESRSPSPRRNLSPGPEPPPSHLARLPEFPEPQVSPRPEEIKSQSLKGQRGSLCEGAPEHIVWYQARTLRTRTQRRSDAWCRMCQEARPAPEAILLPADLTDGRPARTQPHRGPVSSARRAGEIRFCSFSEAKEENIPILSHS